MIETLKHRNFALLWFAGLISMIGDWVLIVGLPVFIFNMTGSTLATGGLLIVSYIPGLIFGSIAGVFVDRCSRQRTMIVTNLLRGIVLLPLLLVHSVEQSWIVYVVLFTGSAVSQFFLPAERTLLPSLVDESLLIPANTLNALNGSLARLIGPVLGGLIVASCGIIGVALIDTLSFFVAAALIALITSSQKAPPIGRIVGVSAISSLRQMVSEWREGLGVIRQKPPLMTLLALSTLSMLGEGFFGTLFVPFVLNVIHGTESEYGFLLAFYAIGGVVGGVIVARVGNRISPTRLFAICAIIFGLLNLSLYYYPLWIPGITLGFVLITLAGLPSVGYFSSQITLLQTMTPAAYRGRIFGMFGALAALSALVGSLVSGILGQSIDVVLLLTVSGLGYLVPGILAWILL